ncbi:MAG TPA: chemotaxis protein CheW [Thermoanaerobaculia bacterium]|nr:chemotaxis protein CheW [Thermoanaerobaculia bacterium]
MVDLVKIRKKAKERKERGPQEETAAPAKTDGAPVSSPASAAVKGAAPRKTKGAARKGAAPPGGAPSERLSRFLETAGQRQVTAAARAEATAAQIELLTFIIAGEQYALDIEHVSEIVTPRPVTRVPNTEDSIVGIFSLRGSIVTLIDVRGRLGHGREGEPGPETRIVVVRQESENIGFVVDRVLRVVKVDVDAVEPHPVTHATEHDESVRGVFHQAGALVIVLDLDNLVHGTHV